jgi:hypothetical protein
MSEEVKLIDVVNFEKIIARLIEDKIIDINELALLHKFVVLGYKNAKDEGEYK